MLTLQAFFFFCFMYGYCQYERFTDAHFPKSKVTYIKTG